MLALTPLTALYAQDQCVRVAGVESSGQKQSMDPADMFSGDDALHINAVYNRLMDADDNFNVQPELAESWEANDDATEWTFKLRQGVKFHDGHELTAKDVVYTYKRLIDPARGSGGAAVLSFLDPADPDAIMAVDDYTVKFKPKGPIAELPILITNKYTYIVPDGAQTDDLRLKGDGTGPFMQKEFTPGGPLRVLAKNPDYWEADLPKADCLEIRVIQEATTRNAALAAGQIDVSTGIDFATLPALQADPNITVMKSGPGTSMLMAMWVDTAPFDKLEVRQALKAVVDREQMVQTVLLGNGVAGNDNPVPPTRDCTFEKQARKQDIDKAKQLLAAAGYNESNPLTVDLYTAEAIPGIVNMTQLYKEQAAQAGIEVNVIQTPADTYWSETWLKNSFVISGWGARPVAEALAIAHRSNAPEPESHFKRPDFDALMDKANQTVDATARCDLYKEAQKMISDEGGSIIPLFVFNMAAMRTACEGYTPRVQILRPDWRYVSCKS
jgi:peptide/nickel transport system substrate-binding protein